MLGHSGTSDDGEHGVWLVQRDGQTQGLQVLLLMEKVRQLLLPARDIRHSSIIRTKIPWRFPLW